mmetsp:Transcript_126223/g.252135  ORF Transcript_126223/g.252135 Transcript_126223/m.252135 type:complete len:249 (+) Transcript_126223:996-1742(+)
MLSNISFSMLMCSWWSSSSDCSFNSCSWCWVLVIIFSLTTAVRIDRSVQELVIMKNTNANFSDGNVSRMLSMAVDSFSEEAPLITRKSVNMLSGTVAKGCRTSSGMSCPGGKASLCPIKLVVMMPMPYNVTMVNTSTHTTPWNADTILVTSMNRGRTDLTSLTRRKIRNNRSILMSIITLLRLIPSFPSSGPTPKSDFRRIVTSGVTQESATELHTMKESRIFQVMSGLLKRKNSIPNVLIRTESSNT